jgi:hypothetical protein
MDRLLYQMDIYLFPAIIFAAFLVGVLLYPMLGYFVKLYYRAVLEVCVALNKFRNKNPGDRGYIDGVEVIQKGGLTVLTTLGSGITDTKDEAADKTSELTGAPLTVYVVGLRLVGMTYLLAVRRLRRLRGLPSDDDQTVPPGSPVTPDLAPVGAA